MDKAVEQTARVLAQLGSNNQPSKGFQNLIRQIGEAKTKHVSPKSANPPSVRPRVCLPLSPLSLRPLCSPSFLPSVLHLFFLVPPSLLPQEEDRIIKKESSLLKDRIGARDVTQVTDKTQDQLLPTEHIM